MKKDLSVAQLMSKSKRLLVLGFAGELLAAGLCIGGLIMGPSAYSGERQQIRDESGYTAFVDEKIEEYKQTHMGESKSEEDYYSRSDVVLDWLSKNAPEEMAIEYEGLVKKSEAVRNGVSYTGAGLMTLSLGTCFASLGYVAKAKDKMDGEAEDESEEDADVFDEFNK